MVLPSRFNAKLSQMLCLEAPSNITVDSVDATQLTKVSILAYTGGLVQLDNLPLPVVFDLTTTKAAQSVVMLYGHNPDIPIGHFNSVKISATDIVVEGVFSVINDKTAEITSAAKNGYKWQSSVGLNSDNVEYVAEGEKVTVNGQNFTGPIYVARNNTLREVSILSLGADPNTNVSFSAKQGVAMTFDEWVMTLSFDPAALTGEQKASLQGIYDQMMAAGASETAKAEAKAKAVALKATWGNTNPTGGNNTGAGSSQGNPTGGNNGNNNPVTDPIADIRTRHFQEETRISGIRTLSATYGNPNSPQDNRTPISAIAIRDGWTLEATELAMLRASRPTITHGPGRHDGITPWQVLSAALAQTVRTQRPTLERRFTPQVLDAAHREYRGRIGLQQTLYEAARMNGYTGSINVKANLRQILQAAFSTMDLVNIFAETASVKMLEGYSSVDDSWREFSAIGTANDFKEYTSRRVTGSMNFEKIPADGMLPHGRLAEGDFGNKVDTYGKMYAITRQDIYNDDQNVLDSVPKELGRGGKLGLVRAVYVEFMNNATFFSAGNGNVSSGALSISGLSAAEAVFRGMKGSDGHYLLATPKILLVPTVLFPLAEQLYGTREVLGGTTVAPANNPHAGKFRPVTSPYLSDTTITGNSTTAYYLLADPQDIPVIEVAFLDGRQEPIVESADVDFNQLGVQMRGYWDWGVRKQDPKGGVRSTGV